MYVINKKRVTMLLMSILLGVFAYSYELTKLDFDNQLEETTATPVSGKVIVIDAGHGIPDERSRK